MLDKTAQKAAELAIQQSEQQMQRMMDTLPSLLWSMAPDGSTTFINKKARDYLGVTLDQVQGWGWLETVHPGEQGYVVQELKKSLASGSSHEVEHRLRGADGVYRWQMSRAEPCETKMGRSYSGLGSALISTSESERRIIYGKPASNWREHLESPP
jgi:PAS domain S-box-containing protein